MGAIYCVDSHVSFGFINEAKVQDIMCYLMDNYDVNEGGQK